MIYVSADGHHHWHLQRVAKYSLWNAAKTAEAGSGAEGGLLPGGQRTRRIDDRTVAAPSTRTTWPRFGISASATARNASSLFEGISPGWRDVLRPGTGLPVGGRIDVLPGEYWLREDVNPLGFVKETGGANVPAYATQPTIIPGFDALAQATSTQAGQATTVTLTSSAWHDTATPRYTVVSQPKHGTLEATSTSSQVIYRPASGYTGPGFLHVRGIRSDQPVSTSPGDCHRVDRSRACGRREVLLAGDGTATYGVADQTGGGHEESFQFTAKVEGTVQELQFRTNGTANTGVTGLDLGIFADSAGKPGEVLGRAATVSGQPGTSSWIKATRLVGPCGGRDEVLAGAVAAWSAARSCFTTTSPRRSKRARATSRASRVASRR